VIILLFNHVAKFFFFGGSGGSLVNFLTACLSIATYLALSKLAHAAFTLDQLDRE
jgi:hypothetical protein